MRTWTEVEQYVERHGLQFKVERFNMSLRGCLITLSGYAVAYSVAEAVKVLKGKVR